MAYLYRHIRLDKNEPFYIGIATHLKRAYEKNARKNPIWKSIVSKTSYDIEIIFDDLTREQALEKEIEFIKLYGRIDQKTGTLSNLTDGGEEFNGIWNRGKKRTEEQKQKLRDIAKTKKKRDPECFKRVADKLRGRRLSEEQKKQISNTLKGRSNGPWSDNQREKNKRYWENKEIPISQYLPDGTFVKNWKNRILASKELGIKRESIRTSMRKNTVINGYIFKSGYYTVSPPLPWVTPASAVAPSL